MLVSVVPAKEEKSHSLNSQFEAKDSRLNPSGSANSLPSLANNRATLLAQKIRQQQIIKELTVVTGHGAWIVPLGGNRLAKCFLNSQEEANEVQKKIKTHFPNAEVDIISQENQTRIEIIVPMSVETNNDATNVRMSRF